MSLGSVLMCSSFNACPIKFILDTLSCNTMMNKISIQFMLPVCYEFVELSAHWIPFSFHISNWFLRFLDIQLYHMKIMEEDLFLTSWDCGNLFCVTLVTAVHFMVGRDL